MTNYTDALLLSMLLNLLALMSAQMLRVYCPDGDEEIIPTSKGDPVSILLAA